MKKIFQNILLLLFSLLFVFILIEGAVRILGLSTSYGFPEGTFQKDEILDYTLAPKQEGYFIKQEFKTYVKTNSLGMRDVEYEVKQDDQYRILALGDSFTWGAYGTELENTYLKILERNLNQNSLQKKIQVLNAGVPGYGTDQEFLYLKDRGISLQPDMVLLNFYVSNDFFDNIKSGEMTANAKGQLVTSDNARKTALEKSRDFLLAYSHAYRLIERGGIDLFSRFIGRNLVGKIANWQYKGGIFSIPPSAEFAEAVEKTEGVLDQMYLYTQDQDIELVILVIPAKYQVDDHLREIFLQENELQEIDWGQPQKIINSWAKDKEVKVIDPLPILREKNQDNDFYWRLNPHFNPRGNIEVARILYQELSSENNIKGFLNQENNEQQQVFPWRDLGIFMDS